MLADAKNEIFQTSGFEELEEADELADAGDDIEPFDDDGLSHK
jgi:hypothetical protein